ncbi:MAG: YqjK family protein [Telluria sp.]
MKNELSLAGRRARLLEECAIQRNELEYHAAQVLAPVASFGSGRGFWAGKKIPLMVGGVALGLLLTRPRKIVPLVTGALGLWKMAQPVLETLRQARSAAEAGQHP